MTLILRNRIWDKAQRADQYSKSLYAVGVEAVSDIQEYIDTSVPSGKTYRRGSIKRRATKRNSVPGLRMTTVRGKEARIVGYKFHKASAKGQPPAKDTKKLYKGNKVKRMAAFRVRVYNDVPYATHLEPPAKLHRPFFRVTILKNRNKYRQMIRGRR